MHFYTQTKNGIEPKHFVPMSKDPSKTRPSRVTDARKAAKEGEVWFPSVTGVLNILDKPALVNWKVDQHIQTMFEMFINEPIQSDDYEGFARVVKAKTQERLDAAPKAGTDIHSVLETFFKDYRAPESEVEQKICLNVAKILEEKCGISYQSHPFECEKYFINKTHGFAGCADLVSENWVIDYKSKQEANKFKPQKMQYPEHVRQLAAYGNSMCEVDFRAANIFICLETGEVDFHEAKKEDLEKGWLTFLDCLDIYKRETYSPL